MKVFVVIHRDDVNCESNCKGVFVNKNDAIKCLVDTFNEELIAIRASYNIDNHKMYHDNTFASVDYGEAYYDTFEIQEIEAQL